MTTLPAPLGEAPGSQKRVGRAQAPLPARLVSSRARKLGVEDYLARLAAGALESQERRGGNAPPGSGRIFVEPPGQAMIERGTCRITEDEIELRLFVDLPAVGRRVRGLEAEELFYSDLTRLATATLLFAARREADAARSAVGSEDHEALQAELSSRSLVAFVADGSLLARAGGDDSGPRRDGREVGFRSPASAGLVGSDLLFRTFPKELSMDGFFAARMLRRT